MRCRRARFGRSLITSAITYINNRHRWVLFLCFFFVLCMLCCVCQTSAKLWKRTSPLGTIKLINQLIGDHDHGGTGTRFLGGKRLHEIYNTVQVVFGHIITTILHIVPLRQDWEHCLTNTTPPILVPKADPQTVLLEDRATVPSHLSSLRHWKWIEESSSSTPVLSGSCLHSCIQWRSAASKSPDWYSRCASSANPWKESIRLVGSEAPTQPKGGGKQHVRRNGNEIKK